MNVSGALAIQGFVLLVATVTLALLGMDIESKKGRSRIIALASMAGVLTVASFIACGWFGVTS